MNNPIAYLNGEFVPIDQARLHIFDLGIVGGVAVTEMIRTFRHVPFRLNQHLDRLTKSLDCVGLEAGKTIAELTDICHRVITENAKLIPGDHDLGVIIFVTAGPNTTYVGRLPSPGPTLCVHSFPLPFELWANTYTTGLHLVTVPTRSIPDDVIDPRIKHRSRLHWHLAARQAQSIEPGATAILTDYDGLLTETATGNLCVVDGTTIMTPSAHVLEGVSREYVAEMATTMGLEFIHAPITSDSLAQADEAFLTSTPHCLLPITRFNGKPVGSGQPGLTFQSLIDAWSQSVGVDIIAQMQRGAAT